MATTVFFDLDGTLVDTAPDLGHALNLQLVKHGKAPLLDAAIRPHASHGSRGLIGLGFGVTPEDEDFIGLRDEYLNLYESVLTRSPQLFDGMQTLLDKLDVQAVNWGIVTNKLGRFTLPLVKSLGLYQKAICVVSGDDATKPKPSPQTLLMACQHAQVEPETCLYIGDAQRDIQAGNAAGMKTVVALFGYIDKNDRPAEWDADAMIHMPMDILELL